MCTRTKTSYGCGCAPKRTEDCGSRSCTDVARYHILNEGDCPECKRGGDRVTRGREGKGRYAQKIKARNSAPSAVTRPPLSPISTNLHSSPWAPRAREKEWHSPVRKMADDAWLEEHERRQRDLEATSTQTSARGQYSSPSYKDHARDHRRVALNMVKLEDEIRWIEDAQRAQVRRRAERSNSYDSFATTDSSRSPPRGRTFDSGFHHSSSPYCPKVSPHHGLGRGLGNVVRDTTRHKSLW